ASGESYYAVEFEVTSEGKYAAAIADFRQRQYGPGLFRLLPGPTESGNGNGNGTAETGTAETGKGKKK
ncbi:MAG: hypothetical protein JNJ76_00645, partial [Candidatus Competibacter sp.]|nr:hypothetical protein [Candidatus Competibacter sp.]